MRCTSYWVRGQAGETRGQEQGRRGGGTGEGGQWPEAVGSAVEAELDLFTCTGKQSAGGNVVGDTFDR